MNKTILHMDMNAFFASVEQQANPALRGKPVAICGRGRTVVATCSYEARKQGVRTGMSLYEARRHCPQIIPVRGNHIKYVDTARKIQSICLEYTPLVEVFSIDEVFLDITAPAGTPKDGLRLAGELQLRIKKELGLPCSIGIAPSKILAKLASDREKPDGLVLFAEEDIESVLECTPVEDMCGIGENTKNCLNALGIRTLAQLGRTDVSLLVRHFGFLGNILKKTGRGMDMNPVSAYSDAGEIKSVGHSNTFPRDTRAADVVRAFLLMLCERVGVRLRKYGMIGRTVSFYIRYCDFSGESRQKSLPEYIKTGPDIYAAAARIMDSFMPFKKAVRLVGVTVSGLEKDKGQLHLFGDRARKERFAEAMDRINSRHGEFMIRPLAFEVVEKFTGGAIDVPARVHGFPAGFNASAPRY